MDGGGERREKRCGVIITAMNSLLSMDGASLPLGYAFLEGKRKNKAEYCLPSPSAALRMVSHKMSMSPLSLDWSESSGCCLDVVFFALLADMVELVGVFCFPLVPRVRCAGVDGCDTTCLG